MPDQQLRQPRSLALQEIADTFVRSGQVEVAPCLEDPTDSSTSIPRPVAPALVTQMAQMTVDALGLQQRQWEQKFLEEIKREKRNSQARRSRAKCYISQLVNVIVIQRRLV